MDDFRERQARTAGEAGRAVAAAIRGVDLGGDRPSSRDGVVDHLTAVFAGTVAELAVRRNVGLDEGSVPQTPDAAEELLCGLGDQEREAVDREARTAAVDLVRKHWPAISHVAGLLMGHPEGLSADRVARIVACSQPNPFYVEA